MSNNNGNSNLCPDWCNQNWNDDLPSDLQDVEPLNSSLPNYELGQIAGSLFVSVEQRNLSNWANDPFVGHAGNHMSVQDEVVYTQTASNSPSRLQQNDLQIADLSQQSGSSTPQFDAALNYGNLDGPNPGSSLFPMDHLTPLQPSGFNEFYTNEPRNDLTTEYGSFTQKYPDYQQHDLRGPGTNSVRGEFGLSCTDFGAQSTYGFVDETSSNSLLPESGTLYSGVEMPSSFRFVGESSTTGVLGEVGSSCPSLGVPSGHAFLGDPRNNGALGGSEVSFTLLGAWQPPREQLSKNPGPSSGAVPRRSSVPTAGGSSSFPQEGERGSSSSSGFSNYQGNLAPDNHNQCQKRNRTPKSVYDKMSEEEKLAQKRKQRAKASKKYWERKRELETLNRHNFDAQMSRNSDLQENLTRDQRRVQLMYLALQSLNINPNRSHVDDGEDDDSFNE